MHQRRVSPLLKSRTSHDGGIIDSLFCCRRRGVLSTMVPVSKHGKESALAAMAFAAPSQSIIRAALDEQSTCIFRV